MSNLSKSIAFYTRLTLNQIENAHETNVIGTGYSVEKDNSTAGPVYLVTKAGEVSPYRVVTAVDTNLPAACNCPWFQQMPDSQARSKDGVIIANTEAACKHLYLSFMTYRANKGDRTAAQLLNAVGESYNDYWQHEYDCAQAGVRLYGGIGRTKGRLDTARCCTKEYPRCSHASNSAVPSANVR